MKNRWKYLSFSTQMKIAFIGIFIIPFFLLFGIQIYNMKNTMETKSVRYMESNMKQAARSISDSLQTYINASFQMIVDTKFISQLKELSSDDYAAYIYARQGLVDSFQTLSSYHSYIQNLGVKPHDSSEVIWFDRSEDYDSIESIYTGYFSEEDHSPSVIANNIWDHTTYYSIAQRSDCSMFTYRQKVIDFPGETSLGVFLMNINESILFNFLEEARISNDPADNFLVITDESGYVLYDPQDLLTGTAITAFLESHPQIIHSQIQIPNTDWYLVDLMNRKYAIAEIYTTFGIMLAAAVILLLSTVFAANIIAKSMSGSIEAIVASMKTAETGELAPTFEDQNQNEINLIGRQFNLMIETIKRQMEMIKQTTERKKEAEIRSLEAQLDPHFLYNTLDSINWMAIDQEQYQISNMLCDLAIILRYRISNSNSRVTISEEIFHLEKYLILQKERYSDCFEYFIDIEHGLEDCLIYKLLFQPFVENALVHGFGEIDHGGLLHILVEDHDRGHIRFTIQDNGKGMSREQKLLLFEDEIKDTGSIGIPNVRNRLALYYDDAYTLYIRSEPGKGTKIEILLPKQYQEDPL